MNHHMLDTLWRRRWAGALAAAAVAALAGLAVAFFMPRGPATAAQALVLMALGLAVGLAAGLLMRSHWALLLAPAVTILAIEMGRRGLAGLWQEKGRL